MKGIAIAGLSSRLGNTRMTVAITLLALASILV
jgi:hypothetical protein